MARRVFRWLLILLALLASAPAAAQMPRSGASCHEDAPAAHAVPMRQHAPDAAPPHACVGCVPVGDWLAPHIAAPILPPAPAPLARITGLDLRDAAPPPLRPPRIG